MVMSGYFKRYEAHAGMKFREVNIYLIPFNCSLQVCKV